MSQAFTVHFEPSGAQAIDAGEHTLLELARGLGLTVESSCGGRGNCRSCAVRIEGHLPAATDAERAVFSPEELAAGWRRACQTRPVGPCRVHLATQSAGAQLSVGQDAQACVVPIAAPIWTSDQDALGLAVDLGTTNLAGTLLDLRSGAVLGAATITNPQVAFGGDLISRMEYARRGADQARQLQQAALDAIVAVAKELTQGDASRIAAVAVVGNTVMQHLLLGHAIDSLARAPYRPATLAAVELPAATLGLPFAPAATLYCAPNVAGFVGGDHLAALLEVLGDAPPGRWAMLDIGTNTEIALCVDGTITSVSCASGPAFEGGKLTCGMRAAPGAIDRVSMGESLEISTLGNLPPLGLCGSGVLSLLAALKRAGLVDARGRLPLGHPAIRERGSSREFVLRDEPSSPALPVVFTQGDVRAVQLAKAAIRTGLDLLLHDAGLEAAALDRIILAGAFGSFVCIDDAITIGLLPELPPQRVVQFGNAAAAGACRLLVCAQARQQVDALARSIRTLELASDPLFQKTFIVRSQL